MRITVLGASGRTGLKVVEQALAAGHEVSAVIRESPGSAAAISRLESYASSPTPAGRLPGTTGGRLRVIVADVRDGIELADAIAGRDAVLSALGPRGRSDPGRIASTATSAAVAAMTSTGVRRVVVISAAPVGSADGGSLGFRVARPILRTLFAGVYADLARMEDELRGSGLDWTAVRPPRLTDGPYTGTQVIVRGRVAPGFTVSRADVAAAMLGALDDPTTVGTTLGVSGA